MKVQGRLMQERFIEIHQVLEKKSDNFVTDHVYYMVLGRIWVMYNVIPRLE